MLRDLSPSPSFSLAIFKQSDCLRNKPDCNSVMVVMETKTEKCRVCSIKRGTGP